MVQWAIDRGRLDIWQLLLDVGLIPISRMMIMDGQ